MEAIQVIIIGAGLAGLNCALHLRRQNVPFLILDAADAVGGRMRTDVVDGYKLDRGFQVLLTAYPEAKQVLNYKKLNLKSYIAGAMVRHNGRFHKVSDPWRDPANMLNTISAPVGTTSDKLCLAKLQLELAYLMIQNDEAAKHSTMDLLKKHGFSASMIERFFRPFFGGVFLENKLDTSGKNFEFLFRMFASGDTAIPENGMEEIPRQLAELVGSDNIRLNSKVRAIAADTVWLESGQRFEAPHIVIATDIAAMKALTDNSSSTYPPTAATVPASSATDLEKSVTCLYFSADTAPIDEAILVLNGEGHGPINNLSVPSSVSPSYAPEGKSLISATVLGNPSESDEALKLSVRGQLAEWFGSDANRWNQLRTYRIKNALPKQEANNAQSNSSLELRQGLYACGDYMSIGSINGALESGRRVAELIGSKVPVKT